MEEILFVAHAKWRNSEIFRSNLFECLSSYSAVFLPMAFWVKTPIPSNILRYKLQMFQTWSRKRQHIEIFAQIFQFKIFLNIFVTKIVNFFQSFWILKVKWQIFCFTHTTEIKARMFFLRNHHFYRFSWKSGCNKLIHFQEKKHSKMSFPHRLKYGGNYKICILPIVQKTAGKKNVHNFQSCESRFTNSLSNHT